MTGDEHYREAERLLRDTAAKPPTVDAQIPALGILMQRAEVHATLALAAATARSCYGHAAYYGGIEGAE